MGKIDISSDDLVASMVAGIRAASNGMRRRAGDDPGTFTMYLSVRSGLVAALSLAVKTRTDREVHAARDIVQSGECEMAWNLPTPEWWHELDRCCPAKYGYHILYGSGAIAECGDRPDDDADLVICPYGRGFWQLARELLADAPQLLRKIAKASARDLAPRWTHWTKANGRGFR